MEEQLDKAQFASFYNRNSIQGSQMAGCFHCESIFTAHEVVDWLDEQYEREASAVCPRCKVSAVIGDAAGYPIETEFLRRMNKRWFADTFKK